MKVRTLCAGLTLLSVSSAAMAEEAPCVPFDADSVGALVLAGRDALFNEDLMALAAIDHTLRERAPCLDHVVNPDAWAPHLVTRAVSAYATVGDWQSPLESALSASPSVDRLVGPEHPIASWSPPARTGAGATRAPDGVEVFLDGRRVRYLPPLNGPHLVQVRTPDWLRSAYRPDSSPVEFWAELLPVAPAVDSAPAPVVRRWVLPTGLGLAVGGAALGVGAWAARDTAQGDAQRELLLVSANTAGWGLAAVGGGLLGWHWVIR